MRQVTWQICGGLRKVFWEYTGGSLNGEKFKENFTCGVNGELTLRWHVRLCQRIGDDKIIHGRRSNIFKDKVGTQQCLLPIPTQMKSTPFIHDGSECKARSGKR